ncbi:hypothetical protein FDB34_16185 [Clostridium botulinum]|nr:hypothetical protein [Clostridium botulinum]
MAFELEKNMTDILKNNFLAIIKSINTCWYKEQFIYAYEFPVYYRMIDITLASYCKEYNEFDECKEYQKIIRNLSPNCFNILALMSLKKRTSVSLIKRELLVEDSELKFCLDKLNKLGLVKKVSKYSYQCTEWSVILPQALIAIELKLSRWQEALEQGIFNQRFAEYSFVVLDKERIKINEKIEKLYKENNVGLIYLSSDGLIEFIVRPKKNRNINKYVNQFHKLKILKDFIVNDEKWKQIP